MAAGRFGRSRREPGAHSFAVTQWSRRLWQQPPAEPVA